MDMKFRIGFRDGLPADDGLSEATRLWVCVLGVIFYIRKFQVTLARGNLWAISNLLVGQK